MSNGTTVATQEEVQGLRDQLTENVLIIWTVLSAINILCMQIGFAMLEVGGVHRKHSKSILMKNLMDTCFGALAWYVLGYGIFTGDANMVGGDFFSDDTTHFAAFIVSYCFAVTTCTIVSGAVAARMQLKVYLTMSMFLVGVYYPIAAHMVWSPEGALNHYIDFAGGVVVHGIGGVWAMVGAAMSGPRVGRFTDEPDHVFENGLKITNGVKEMPGSSSVLQCVGTMLLFCAWFSFNAVSSGAADAEGLDLSLRAAMNTLIAASAAAAFGLVAVRVTDGYYGLAKSLNYLLAGLVAITPCCAFVDTWAAVLIGIGSVVVLTTAENVLLYRCRVDDPLSASPLHGGVGMYGGICTGIFHRDLGLVAGLTEQFLTQLWITTALALGSALAAFLFFGMCKLALGGSISCSEDDQLVGLDFIYHDGKKLDSLSKAEVAIHNATRAAMRKKKQEKMKKAQQSFFSKKSAKHGTVAPAVDASGEQTVDASVEQAVDASDE